MYYFLHTRRGKAARGFLLGSAMTCPSTSPWPSWAAPSLVTGAVAVAWGASALVDFSTYAPPRIVPRKGAFAIWLAIFPGLVVGSAWTRDAEISPLAWLALVTSLLCAAAWALAARARAYRIAAALLLCAAAGAWVHAVLAPAWPSPCAPRFLPAEAAGGLYAGWLSVASAVGLAIAWPGVFDRPDTAVGAAAQSMCRPPTAGTIG